MHSLVAFGIQNSTDDNDLFGRPTFQEKRPEQHGHPQKNIDVWKLWEVA